MVMSGRFGFGALRHLRIDLEFGERRAGRDHVAGLAVHLRELARERRRHFDDGLRGLHRDQRLVELDGAAFLDEPLDDRRVGQAFAEVGEVECLHVGHDFLSFVVQA